MLMCGCVFSFLIFLKYFSGHFQRPAHLAKIYLSLLYPFSHFAADTDKLFHLLEFSVFWRELSLCCCDFLVGFAVSSRCVAVLKFRVIFVFSWFFGAFSWLLVAFPWVLNILPRAFVVLLWFLGWFCCELSLCCRIKVQCYFCVFVIFRCFFVITRCVSVSSQYIAAISRCVAVISWLVLLWALIVFRFELTFCFREFSVFFLITRCVSVISRYIAVSTRSISLCFYFPWIVVVLYKVYLTVLV